MSLLPSLVKNVELKAQSEIWRDRILPALFAAGLGLVLLYAAGFAETAEVHNAAHDGRHLAAFPCH